MCQASGPVRPSLPRMSATRSGPPARPSVKRPRPGSGIGSSPSSTPNDMPRPTDTYDTSVVDLMESPKCRRNAGVASLGPITATRSPYSSTRPGSGSRTASPRRTSTILASMSSGNTMPPTGTPVNAARDTKNLAMSSALRSLATCPASTRPSCCRAWSSAAELTEQQQAVSGVEPNLRIGQPVLPSVSNGHQVHARRQAGDQFAERCAGPLARQHDLDDGGRRRRRHQAGSDEARENEDAEDGCDDADRIRDRVADGGGAFAGGIDGGLQAPGCWSARRRTSPACARARRRTPGPPPAATPSETHTPTAPSAFHFSPDPRKPAKNCRPY